jgi:hypothetical protein
VVVVFRWMLVLFAFAAHAPSCSRRLLHVRQVLEEDFDAFGNPHKTPSAHVPYVLNIERTSSAVYDYGQVDVTTLRDMAAVTVSLVLVLQERRGAYLQRLLTCRLFCFVLTRTLRLASLCQRMRRRWS